VLGDDRQDAYGSSGPTAGRFARNSFPQNGAIKAIARFSTVFLLFSLITLIFFGPEIDYLHSALIGPPEDNMQDFRDTRYVLFAYDPSHFFRTTLLRQPEGRNGLYAWNGFFTPTEKFIAVPN
jgi:hypothetical protein